MADMEFVQGMSLLMLCFLCGSSGLSLLQDDIVSIKENNKGSLNFLVVGDWGRKGDYNQSRVAYQMGKIGEELTVEFIISTGDNFYEEGLTGVSDRSFQESFSKIYTAKSLQKPWHAILGNHDYRGNVLAQLSQILKRRDYRWHCKRSFTLQRKFHTTSLLEMKENPASVELFFVDTTPFVKKYWEIPNKHTYDWRGVGPREGYVRRQLQELARGLKASNATWKIVIGHHPIRSVGHHGDTDELLQLLLPILETYKVDMYVNGHDHCLQHIQSVTSDLQFLTSGGGSKSWRGINENANMNGLKMYYDGQGFMSMQITPTNMCIAFYDIEGNIIHKFDTYKNDKYFFEKF